jgi:hypothetical protein
MDGTTLAQAGLALPGERGDPRDMVSVDDVGALAGKAPKPLRLYRGLTRPYDRARVQPARNGGTDFTDCPFTALRYAVGPRGVVLVLDVPAGHRRVSEELWMVSSAKRFMVWGAFDEFLVAELPAKELRAHVRRKGVVAAADEYKATVLRRAITDRLSRS